MTGEDDDMGFPLLLALALIATGLLFMAAEARARRRHASGRRPQGPMLAGGPDMELAEEVAPGPAAEPALEPPAAPPPDPGTLDQAFEADAADDGEQAPEPEQPDVVEAAADGPGVLRVRWELCGRDEERLRTMLGERRFRATQPCLRVFDTVGGQVHAADLSFPGDGTVVRGLQPGRRYVVALERRSPEGDRYLIALSAPVEA